jgi:RHS repeat-associated protein
LALCKTPSINGETTFARSVSLSLKYSTTLAVWNGQSFTDDKLGNFWSAASVKCSSYAPQFGIDANNHINSAGYSYDLAGNSTADGQWTYTYDAENRITSARGMGGGPYCYAYDGNDVRVKKSNGTSCATATVDVLYWRNITGENIAETDSTGSTANANYHEYVFFVGRRVARSDPSSGIQYYYFADQIGSTRSVAEVTPSNSPTDGTVCFNADYYPYGQEIDYTTTCLQNYKFTGYERDGETGLVYALARYYNDRLGRFMSADPLGGDVSNPQSLNRYTYVLNNPPNLIDPSGMDPCSWDRGGCVPPAVWGPPLCMNSGCDCIPVTTIVCGVGGVREIPFLSIPPTSPIDRYKRKPNCYRSACNPASRIRLFA